MRVPKIFLSGMLVAALAAGHVNNLAENSSDQDSLASGFRNHQMAADSGSSNSAAALENIVASEYPEQEKSEKEISTKPMGLIPPDNTEIYRSPYRLSPEEKSTVMEYVKAIFPKKNFDIGIKDSYDITWGSFKPKIHNAEDYTKVIGLGVREASGFINAHPPSIFCKFPNSSRDIDLNSKNIVAIAPAPFIDALTFYTVSDLGTTIAADYSAKDGSEVLNGTVALLQNRRSILMEHKFYLEHGSIKVEGYESGPVFISTKGGEGLEIVLSAMFAFFMKHLDWFTLPHISYEASKTNFSEDIGKAQQQFAHMASTHVDAEILVAQALAISCMRNYFLRNEMVQPADVERFIEHYANSGYRLAVNLAGGISDPLEMVNAYKLNPERFIRLLKGEK